MSIFKDKVLLITGGTGSFGNAVLKRFVDSDLKEIRIFSRDEKKQDNMRHSLQLLQVHFQTLRYWCELPASGKFHYWRCT